METKFYTFNQNNSGGYFVVDKVNGVCECVIIEAESSEKAYGILSDIGKKVTDFWDYCSCCGERWDDYVRESNGTNVPTIFGKPINESKAGLFRNQCFVHYLDGRIEHVIFPEN